jgi:hypothetical protein
MFVFINIMKSIYNIFYTPPPLTNAEKKENEEYEWYNDYVDWCQYDYEKNQCVGHKSMISDKSIVTKLFNMFNEFLLINENVIMKFQPKARYSFLTKADTNVSVYYLKEDAARKFITEFVKDDWDNYKLLNKDIYNKHRIVNELNVPYIVLDAFVYSFSRYDDLMKVAFLIDDTPTPDMPIKPKNEPLQLNSPIKTLSHSVQSNTKLKMFEDYIQQPLADKKGFVKRFYSKVIKQNKQLNNNKSNNEIITNLHTNEAYNSDIQEDDNSNYQRKYINTSVYKKGFDGIIQDEDLKGGTCFTSKSISKIYLGGMDCIANRIIRLPNKRKTPSVLNIVTRHKSAFKKKGYVPFKLYDKNTRDELVATLDLSASQDVCLGAAFKTTEWTISGLSGDIKQDWKTYGDPKGRDDGVVILNLNTEQRVEGIVVMFCREGKAVIETLCKSCEAIIGTGMDLMYLALLSAYFVYGCNNFKLTAAAIDDVICDKEVTAQQLINYYSKFGFNRVSDPQRQFDMTMTIDKGLNPIEVNALKGGAKHVVNGKVYTLKTSKNGKQYIERKSFSNKLYKQYIKQ